MSDHPQLRSACTVTSGQCVCQDICRIKYILPDRNPIHGHELLVQGGAVIEYLWHAEFADNHDWVSCP